MSIIDPPRAAKWPKGGIVIGALAAIAVTAGLFVAAPHIHFGALIPVVSEEVAPEEVAPHTHMVQVATHGINSWEEWYGHQEVYFTTPVPAFEPRLRRAPRRARSLGTPRRRGVSYPGGAPQREEASSQCTVFMGSGGVVRAVVKGGWELSSFVLVPEVVPS